jgi:hypothetical protein
MRLIVRGAGLPARVAHTWSCCAYNFYKPGRRAYGRSPWPGSQVEVQMGGLPAAGARLAAVSRCCVRAVTLEEVLVATATAVAAHGAASSDSRA